jgi:uncharacterized membrane protein
LPFLIYQCSCILSILVSNFQSLQFCTLLIQACYFFLFLFKFLLESLQKLHTCKNNCTLNRTANLWQCFVLQLVDTYKTIISVFGNLRTSDLTVYLKLALPLLTVPVQLRRYIKIHISKALVSSYYFNTKCFGSIGHHHMQWLHRKLFSQEEIHLIPKNI